MIAFLAKMVVRQGAISGRLFDLGYFRHTLIISSIFMTVANFLIAECKKYWQFILCQGILLGVSDISIASVVIKLISAQISAGTVYIPCIAVVSHWCKFQKRNTLWLTDS